MATLRGRLAAIALLSIALQTPTPAHAAATPGDRCQSRKARIAAAAARRLMSCYARLASGSSIPPTCTSRPQENLDRAYTGAESGGMCKTTGDAATIWTRLEQFTGTVQTVFTNGPSRCVAGKMNAEARALSRMLVAHARDNLHPDPAHLAAALADAQARCVTDFANADNFLDCPNVVDATLECARPGVHEAGIAALLFATCGDGVRTGTEECDAQDATACPGRCRSDCTCAPPGDPVCGNDLIDPGEQCDGVQPGSCAQQTFLDQCAAPGGPSECQCCSASVCLYDGFSIPCCPGLTCVPTGGIHTQGLCQAPTPCGGSLPMCNCTCGAGEECAAVGPGLFPSCVCLPVGSTPCGSPGAPVCGGACPGTDVCRPAYALPSNGGGLDCACGAPGFCGQGGLDCGNGFACAPLPPTVICAPILCGGGSPYPTCDGSCVAGASCTPFALGDYTECICQVSGP